MAQKETIFKNRIRPQLRALPNCVEFKIQSVATRGIPDFLLCIGGFFVALELKPEARPPDPLQAHTMQRLLERGMGTALLVHPGNWREVKAYLTALGNRRMSAVDRYLPPLLRETRDLIEKALSRVRRRPSERQEAVRVDALENGVKLTAEKRLGFGDLKNKLVVDVEE